MIIHTYTGGLLQTNAYLVESGDDCFVIDAPEGVAEFIKTSGKSPTHLLLTHQHFDHVQDVALLAEMGLTIVAHSTAQENLIMQERARVTWQLPITITPFTVDEILTPGPWTSGSTPWDIRHVPGHSPDSITFYHAESGNVFAGDTLFNGGIGRPDLPGGNHQQLVDAINSQLLSLPSETACHSGHGPSTTVGAEIKSNPYL